MPRPTTVDKNVHSLAELWLCEQERTSKEQHAARVDSLAKDIQAAIEDWEEDERRAAEEQEHKDDEARSLKGYTDTERERI